MDSTKAALTALKGRAKTVAKADKAAYNKDVAAAQAKAGEAAKRLSAANRAVAQQKPIVAGLLDQRDKFVTTITWILDPSASSEQRAAGPREPRRSDESRVGKECALGVIARWSQ